MNGSNNYSIKDLRFWSEKIEKLLSLPSFNIDFYPQEFELVDYETMLEAQAYTGMPSFYPHLSFGKSYELLATMYHYGFSYLPYELVINSNPCIAKLRRENDLALQILTMAHVYYHNNFFKNNIHFRRLTNASSALDFFHSMSEAVRQYSADPAIGPRAVSKCITAAHGIRYQCRDISVSGLNRDRDLLLFLIDNSPRKIDFWERNLVLMVIEAFVYFEPQMITQIMNEGWASWGHYEILKALKLPPALRFSIEKYHNSVVRLPDDSTTFNPYFIGFEMWKSIQEKNPEIMFQAMRENDDQSFVKKFMDMELMEKTGLLTTNNIGDNVIVDEVSDKKNFRDVKEIFISKIGLGQIPVIEVVDKNYENKQGLYLKHVFDGRHLESRWTGKTLEYFYYFWPCQITLETRTYRRNLPFLYEFDGTRHNASRKR